MNDNKPRRRTVPVWCVATFAVLLVAALTVKYWVAPTILRPMVREALSRCWLGPAQIGQITMNYSGQVRLRDLTLLDAQGRRHVYVACLTGRLRDIPVLKPLLWDVSVEGLRLDLHRTGGKLVLPVRWPDESDGFLATHANLQSLEMTDFGVSLHEDGVLSDRLEPCRLTAQRQGNYFSVTIDAPPCRTLPSLSLTGRIGPATDSWQHVTAELRANDKPLIRNLDLLVEHGGAGSQTTAVKLTADALGGRINGKASFWRHNGRQTVYDGTIATKRLNLAGLSDVSAERRICGTGLLTGSLAFHGRGAALEDLQGRGEFLLQDIDAHSDPLTRAVFAFLNSTGGRTVTATDVKATFLIGRGVVTIQQAVLGSPLYVMRAEEGGTIDLRSGQLDVYLVTLDVAGAESLLETVPVVGMVTRFSDKLTRLHVTGMWNDQKFTKEPVKDISRAALELFQEMIVTGGRLPLQMPGPFTGLLRPFQARWLQKQTPASQPTGQRQFDPRGLGTNGR